MLASSRAANRRSAREDRKRALARFFRFLVGLTGTLCGIAFDLVLLAGTPLAYLAASFAIFDLPAGWMFGHKPMTGLGMDLTLPGQRYLLTLPAGRAYDPVGAGLPPARL